MIVLDTHVLVWWVSDPARLSARARRAVQTQASSGAIVASAISLFEIATLVRRGRLVLRVAPGEWFDALLSLPELRIEPVAAHIARLAGSFEASMPGDPADRIVAATALTLEAQLVSADEKLRRAPRLSTIW
ncbi:MAG: type II toxin-antitoxin system VapC family toxin [Burkholderiales bacterium]|nr:type II toxin-antitoxin system VapC family toxin [Burkholderiales bacterium]